MEIYIMAIRSSGTSGVPFGGTAGRPSNPANGQPYFNGDQGRLELFTSNTGWQNIVQETPGVASITGVYNESANSGTITISGTNFVSGAYATAIGTNGVQVDAATTTYNSLVQLVATFTNLSNAYEPYDIKVTNPSNLFGLIPDALYINAYPVWTTASGSLGSFQDNVSMSVSATATDETAITYALASGSTLPSGVTLNSSTGLISGTPPDVASNTTYTFTINASDGVNPVVPRTFSFVSNAATVWNTASGSLGTFFRGATMSTSALSVTDTDTITYSLASGSSLPAGLSINSSTGVISGTMPTVSSDITYNFTINASDGVNTVPRAFSITNTAVTVSGGTLTSDATYYYRTFTGSSNLIVSNGSLPASYLLVAGGGAASGRHSGGGGGGQVTYNASYAIPANTYTVTIGGGGTPVYGSVTQSGLGNDSFFLETARGGGSSGGYSSVEPRSGGSGGGTGYGGSQTGPASNKTTSTLGAITYGNSGGSSGNPWGAGGGGAGGAGANGSQGNGGPGIENSILGTSYYWAGGGGGSAWEQPTKAGDGGIGGGGGGGYGGNTMSTYGGGYGGGSALNAGENGGWPNSSSVGSTKGGNGGANTGGGGGGCGQSEHLQFTSGSINIGGAGGSGILVVRYLRAIVGG